MTEQRNSKQKMLAILVVACLFIIVGLAFSIIGIVNKKQTDKLQSLVRLQKQAAEIKEQLNKFEIINNQATTTAKAFIVLANYKNQDRILFARNLDETLPIASITKLMSAIIAIDNLDLTQKVLASTPAVGGDGTTNILKIGELYTARDLLKSMLIASDNDSARLLSNLVGEDKFVSLMNDKAKILGLNHTHYYNSTGLDPLNQDDFDKVNFSTANNLAVLVKYINNNYPEIWKITQNHNAEICSVKNFCTKITSTNKFLTDNNFNWRILGSKTGQTDLASKNLALIIEPANDIFLISIILNSNDNFLDTRALLNQIKFKNYANN